MSEADKKKKDADYTYEPESGEGDYYISERPWSPNCIGTNSHAIKIRVEHATKEPFIYYVSTCREVGRGVR